MLDNVQPYKIALWNENDTIPLYLSEYSNAGSVLEEFRKVTNKYEKVTTRALDTIIDEVDYIWFNIECAEVKALEGAEDLLMENDVKLCISTHKVTDDYHTKNDVIKILELYGYNCSLVDGHEYWVYAEK